MKNVSSSSNEDYMRLMGMFLLDSGFRQSLLGGNTEVLQNYKASDEVKTKLLNDIQKLDDGYQAPIPDLDNGRWL